jgi:hypothetical protein
MDQILLVALAALAWLIRLAGRLLHTLVVAADRRQFPAQAVLAVLVVAVLADLIHHLHNKVVQEAQIQAVALVDRIPQAALLLAQMAVLVLW